MEKIIVNEDGLEIDLDNDAYFYIGYDGKLKVRENWRDDNAQSQEIQLPEWLALKIRAAIHVHIENR